MHETRFDIVVVGSGAAGLSAALKASSMNRRVLVLEKAATFGGTTALSGAGTWIPANHYMAAHGLVDSPQEALAYLRSTAPAGWAETENDLWRAFAENAPRTLSFIESCSPLRFELVKQPDIYPECAGAKLSGRNVSPKPVRRASVGTLVEKVPRPSKWQLLTYSELIDTKIFFNPRRLSWLLPRVAWRKLTGKCAQGIGLVIGLMKGCLDHGCEFWSDAQACELITDDRRIIGLKVRHEGGMKTVRCSGAILATGGFEWNEELLQKYRPGPSAYKASPPTNTGDGHVMAAAVGAKLERMDQALFTAVMPPVQAGALQGQLTVDYILPHLILVNHQGKRFINECQGNIGLVYEERDPQTGLPIHLPAWRIFDQQYADKYQVFLPMLRAVPNFLRTAATIEELARGLGVEPATLQATIDRYNRFTETGHDEDFRRGDSYWDRDYGGDERLKPNPCLGSICRPPFYYAPFHMSYLGTKGGPRTNEHGQVLRTDGSIIEGLYCAGNAMANPIGNKAVGAGTTIGPCLTWGYICGRTAATRVRLQE